MKNMPDKFDVVIGNPPYQIGMHLKFLELADTFDKALDQLDKDNQIETAIDGLKETHKQFNRILKKEGVLKVVAIGKKLDTNYHEVISVVIDNDKDEETVVGEIQPGFTLNSKLIRPSKVIVSKKGEK